MVDIEGYLYQVAFLFWALRAVFWETFYANMHSNMLPVYGIEFYPSWEASNFLGHVSTH